MKQGVIEDQGALTAHDIAKILPHRYPFLLVDRIIKMEGYKRAIGIKNVTVNEPFFKGHFPGSPIMPGVLIVEAMAQVGGVIVLSIPDWKGKLPYLAGIDKMRFKRPVVPGDQLVIEVNVLGMKGNIGKVSAEARVDGNLVTSGELLFAVVSTNDNSKKEVAI